MSYYLHKIEIEFRCTFILFWNAYKCNTLSAGIKQQ